MRLCMLQEIIWGRCFLVALSVMVPGGIIARKQTNLTSSYLSYSRLLSQVQDCYLAVSPCSAHNGSLVVKSLEACDLGINFWYTVHRPTMKIRWIEEAHRIVRGDGDDAAGDGYYVVHICARRLLNGKRISGIQGIHIWLTLKLSNWQKNVRIRLSYLAPRHGQKEDLGDHHTPPKLSTLVTGTVQKYGARGSQSQRQQN